MKDIKIVVATHKKYKMPTQLIYLPIHVGREGKKDIGYIGDNTGENISLKNDFLNELTGIYWAWKNLDNEYIGLVHYRRYFTMSHILKRLVTKDKYRLIATHEEIDRILHTTDIILPAKRRYYIETIESHYKHLPYTFDEDINILYQLIAAEYSEYLPALEKVMHRRWAHMFNMFIMKKDFLCEYCGWAFPIMIEFDKRINHRGRTVIQNRAYVSEFLLDTWIETRGYKYTEMPVLFVEKQYLLKKAYILIKRKVTKNGN